MTGEKGDIDVEEGSKAVKPATPTDQPANENIQQRRSIDDRRRQICSDDCTLSHGRVDRRIRRPTGQNFVPSPNVDFHERERERERDRERERAFNSSAYISDYRENSLR